MQRSYEGGFLSHEIQQELLHVIAYTGMCALAEISLGVLLWDCANADLWAHVCLHARASCGS